jgi:hypothetical protein
LGNQLPEPFTSAARARVACSKKDEDLPKENFTLAADTGNNTAMLRGASKKSPPWTDLGGSLLGLVCVCLLVTLGLHNEYLFPTWGTWVALIVGLAGALLLRLFRRRPGCEVLFVLLVMNLYSVVFWTGGYSYLGWLAVPVFLCLAITPYLVFRRRERLWRLLFALNLAMVFGTAMLETCRSYAAVNADKKCRAEEEIVPSFVHSVPGPRHPYDFDGVSNERYLGAAFGQTRQFYLLDADQMQLRPAARVPRGVQRVVAHPQLPLYVLPPWSKMGNDERIEFVDRSTGQLVARTSVTGCRNLFTVAFWNDRMFALCEVSHTLHEFSARPPFEQMRSLSLPGMDAYDLAIDPEHGRALVSDYFSPWLTEVDLGAMAVLRRKWVGPFSFHIAFAPDGRVYIAQMLWRRVLVLDPKSLEVVRKIPAGYGPRDFDFDQNRGLLLIGNYYDGTLDVVGLDDGQRHQRVFVGGLLRGLWFDHARDRLYLAAGCGVRWIPGSALSVTP